VNWHRSPASRPGARDGSHGIPVPTAHCQPGGFGSPGASSPGTFRPQGLTTLPTAFSPPRPGDGTSPPQRSWGSPFKALLLPTNWAPFRGLASLVVPQPGTRPSGRDFRGLYGWEGERAATTEMAATPNLAFLGVLPSRAFPFADGERLPALAPRALPAGSAPYGSASGRGFRG